MWEHLNKLGQFMRPFEQAFEPTLTAHVARLERVVWPAQTLWCMTWHREGANPARHPNGYRSHCPCAVSEKPHHQAPGGARTASCDTYENDIAKLVRNSFHRCRCSYSAPHEKVNYRDLFLTNSSRGRYEPKSARCMRPVCRHCIAAENGSTFPS